MVLAGGQARRMDGIDKALVEIGGVTMLDRVLGAAAPNCDVLVVVGPRRPTRFGGVVFTTEPEPGGGPVPAVAAGLEELSGVSEVVVLAVDLPLLEGEHVAMLFAGLDDETVDAVAAADDRGRPNPLLAAYHGDVLRDALAVLGPDVAAGRMLPGSTAVVDLGEAGRLNVNQRDELDRARRLLPPAP